MHRAPSESAVWGAGCTGPGGQQEAGSAVQGALGGLLLLVAFRQWRSQREGADRHGRSTRPGVLEVHPGVLEVHSAIATN